MFKAIASCAAAFTVALAASPAAAAIYVSSGNLSSDGTDGFYVPIMNSFFGGVPTVDAPFRFTMFYEHSNPASSSLFTTSDFVVIRHDDGWVESNVWDSGYDPLAPATLVNGSTLTPLAGGGFELLTRPPSDTCQSWVLGEECEWRMLKGLYLAAPSEAGDTFKYRWAISAVPEPETWALLIAGFGILCTSLRMARGDRRTPHNA